MPRPLAAGGEALSFDALHIAVGELLAVVARDIVLPRFRTLQAHEIVEKTPGEIVTIADHEAETALSEGLAPLLPDARIVGEEASVDTPALLDHLDEGLVWLVDPIDGTANFAAGKPPFGIMIALAFEGSVEAAWLYDPLGDRLCHTARGKGAYIDGVRVRAADTNPVRPVAALATQFMGAKLRAEVEARFAEHCDLVPIPRCAAEHYPRLVLGQNQLALFQRTLPWDHAAGALLLTEAGGIVTRWDGTPYRIGDGKHGLVAAADRRTWRIAMDALGALAIAEENIDPTKRHG